MPDRQTLSLSEKIRHRDMLITTFSTWKPHHISNASDDLLQRVIGKTHHPFHHLRLMPVDFETAPRRVLECFNELRPRILICCGMTEKRSKLNIESSAVLEEKVLQTRVDLESLTADLPMTEISHDAGRFVCNTLYYRVLEHLASQQELHHCVFVHVPVLTEENSLGLEKDFVSIIERLRLMS
jgi:pyroglutamyl-peptidase